MWAAEGDHPEAQYNLYQILCRGEGVEKNVSEGVKWLKRAANQGHDVEALRDLGYLFYEGKHVKKNLKKAVECYRIAAKKNDPKAQWNLGLCYEHGDGVKASARWSVYWIKKAAEQGHEASIEFLKDKAMADSSR